MHHGKPAEQVDRCALVYVGATHLLPQSEAEHKRYSLFALGAGILIALIIVFSKA